MVRFVGKTGVWHGKTNFGTLILENDADIQSDENGFKISDGAALVRVSKDCKINCNDHEFQLAKGAAALFRVKKGVVEVINVLDASPRDICYLQSGKELK